MGGERILPPIPRVYALAFKYISLLSVFHKTISLLIYSDSSHSAFSVFFKGILLRALLNFLLCLSIEIDKPLYYSQVVASQLVDSVGYYEYLTFL